MGLDIITLFDIIHEDLETNTNKSLELWKSF